MTMVPTTKLLAVFKRTPSRYHPSFYKAKNSYCTSNHEFFIKKKKKRSRRYIVNSDMMTSLKYFLETIQAQPHSPTQTNQSSALQKKSRCHGKKASLRSVEQRPMRAPSNSSNGRTFEE
ncbi:hypothetical protein TNCT_152811 [Trichonephila clavata]|uniref:Uncharacterized protein n=1 Tax=Trichonephila clavata TaxID=2740835 RepID=A0A8X6GCD2_TRICU|nr:hypothetical protein TNCT_152811 [Trichonephila clavata]